MPATGAPRQHHRRLHSDELRRLVADYVAGVEVIELAKRYRVSRQTVFEHMRRLGAPKRNPRLSPAEVQQAAGMYSAGGSLATIGKVLGVDPGTVSRALVKIGVTMRLSCVARVPIDRTPIPGPVIRWAELQGVQITLRLRTFTMQQPCTRPGSPAASIARALGVDGNTVYLASGRSGKAGYTQSAQSLKLEDSRGELRDWSQTGLAKANNPLYARGVADREFSMEEASPEPPVWAHVSPNPALRTACRSLDNWD